MASMGGRTGLRARALAGEREDRWLEPEEGREWELCLSESVEEGPMDSLRGDFWCVLRDESLEGRAKDCSKGLGSRSKVDRFGRGGGRWGFSCVWCLSSVLGEATAVVFLSWAMLVCSLVLVTTMTNERQQQNAHRFSPPL